jgi:hypothetical protein
VRRAATIALGILAVLASACGEAAIPPRLATTLEDRVALIRQRAEAGRPGLAIAATHDLMTLVTQRLHAGRIEDSKAVEILEAAQLVVQRLEPLPRQTAESPSPIPSPSEEGEGDDGKPDEGDGKGKGNGNGDEGHGKDD